MRCLTWNLEWARPATDRGTLISQAVSGRSPDVVCYTETIRGLVPQGHRIEADADYGYPHNGSRRKVILWSTTPWEEADIVGDPLLPPGRFASGVAGGIRYVGVCIPWKDAHVTSGRRDRQPWEDHLRYCEGLGKVLCRYAEMPHPVCILGDFNQRIPKSRQPAEVAEALAAALPSDFTIATEGLTDADGHQLIDHIGVSAGLNATEIEVIPRFSSDGIRLSDHVGVATTLKS